jgi:nucleoside-diphosphate-sugar epimerase
MDAGLSCRVLMRSGKEAPAGAVVAKGDLFDTVSLTQAVKGVAAVIHLAAVFRTSDIDLIWKSNLEGTRNLIDAVRSHAPNARFIMASTTNIYDINSPHPGREDDAADPKMPYPASKLAAENELRKSGLNWSIQRFGFVYGDNDGHLEAVHKHAINATWHPAQKMSMIHHRDIATAMNLALTGAMDGRIVNIVDDAPTSIYELVEIVGEKMESSSEPLPNPWYLHVDSSLGRSLGFRPTVRTVYQAQELKLM